MEDTHVYWFLCLLLVVLAVKLSLQTRKKGKNLPPSPPAIPFIGHLHLLRQPIHRTLENLSKKYGPIMSLRLGPRPVLVVSSPSAVEECFTKNDIVFANRPQFLAGKFLHYNNTTLASASYGDHWRNLRRICAIEIFSSSRLNAFLAIRKDEIKRLASMFMDLTFNIVMRMIAGKRYYGEDVKLVEEANKFKETLQGYSALSELTNLGDMFPIFKSVDFNGFIKRCTALSGRMDLILQGLIDELRRGKNGNTMINHLLTLQESEPEYYTDEIIKGLVLIMLLAGTKTLITSIEWGVCNLFNHPDVVKKAREELDSQTGLERLVDESDFSKLPYLQSIILENLRLYPVVPLLAPHISSADCKVGGYDVPAGTILLVNAWAIHRDPQIWDDPGSFKPERFENRKSEAYEQLPFGLGRRACPGEVLAHKIMALTLGSLIQCFEWETVGGKKIDMTEKMINLMGRAEPLEVMCKARPNLNNVLS
ncbi:cytochrome P450 family protein [Salix suchowensis]|nr:cytochrome P450 family protein [Salix suchowensis]